MSNPDTTPNADSGRLADVACYAVTLSSDDVRLAAVAVFRESARLMHGASIYDEQRKSEAAAELREVAKFYDGLYQRLQASLHNAPVSAAVSETKPETQNP